jgi:catechol 2,3-dioxygenase-like lactoylglutathione lyase family enzyme
MSGVEGFFHAGITVESIDRSLAFYRDGLGLKVAWDREFTETYLARITGLDFSSVRIVFLEVPGGGLIELLEYRGIDRVAARARACDLGVGHICLYVRDADGIATRLRALGYEMRSRAVTTIDAGPNRGGRTSMFADPDGYLVELFQRRASIAIVT